MDWFGLGVGTGLDRSVLGQTSLCWQTGLDWSVLVLGHTHLYWVRLVCIESRDWVRPVCTRSRNWSVLVRVPRRQWSVTC